nr:PREDICTED: F-box only protein 21-like [Linepithema humile]
MAIITDLPIDVIIIILCNKSISFKDIISLALSCNKFYNLLTTNNELWQKKFYQRWPHLREEYDEQLCLENKGFLEQVKAENLISHKDITQENLLSYLQYYRLKKKVHEFLNYPEKQQILEKAVFIVAQWYQLVYQRQNQKYMSYLYVSTSLHKITEQVLECLRNEYPAHPICSISEEQLSFWENNNIDDNHWNSIEGRQIIESLCKVLYDKLRFRGTESNILKYSCRLDYVFKHKIGTTVILATIYHSVARRLGIRCDIIFHKFKEEFFLCWRAKYHTTNLKEEECFDIEFMRNEQTVGTNDCPIINIAKYGIDEYTKKSPVELCLCHNLYFKVMTYMNTNLYLEIGDVESATQMYGKLQNLINQYTCN